MTALLEEKFYVGGNTFISPKWPTRTKAFKNLGIVGKYFAVPISFLFSKEEADLESKIPQALFMLFDQLSESDAGVLIDLILSDVRIDDTARSRGVRPVNADTDLEDISDLIELIALVLKQQYGKLVSGKSFTSLMQVMIPLHQVASE